MAATDDKRELTRRRQHGSEAASGERVRMEAAAREVRELARSAARRGEPLPSEPALVAKLGISRPSLREILARMEAEGLIRRRQGAMTIVNPAAEEIVARFDHHLDPAEKLRRGGFEPTFEVLESGETVLGPADAAALFVTRGARALRTVKRWSADGVPVLVVVDVIPVVESSVVDLATIDATATVWELVRLLRGDKAEWELAWPGAVAPDAALKSWLGGPLRRALLTLELVGVGRRGQRCYRTSEYHVPGIAPCGFIRSLPD